MVSNDCDLLIFGAAGDLSGRKLYPALFQLHCADLLPADMRIIGLARRHQDRQQFLEAIKHRVAQASEGDPAAEQWARFCQRLDYCCIDFGKSEEYQRLAAHLSPGRRAIFYLATPPSLFGPICEKLGANALIDPQSRLVLEKPVGQDLASCQAVNETVAQFFSEENIYRIDHYLGKETVQNLLVLRFANRFINAQWDQSCIDHIQITVAETVGIEGRWSYYDGVGQLRDMVQNHLMQLLCLVAMEPPNAMTAESIRDEKVKIMRALRRIDAASVGAHAVRGQYAQGWYRGEAVPAYIEEADSDGAESDTETFVAIKAHIDNWRWAGVPFYLRTGKRMPEKLTEIVITYKSLPHNIFSTGENIPNRLVIRLQPNEGIEMQMVSKMHSLKNKMALARQNLNLDFLGSSGMNRIPDAYERLFLDVINGDPSLFVGREEVEEAWQWCDALIQAWQSQAMPVSHYHAGSWGPAKAELLIERDGRSWHE